MAAARHRPSTLKPVTRMGIGDKRPGALAPRKGRASALGAVPRFLGTLGCLEAGRRDRLRALDGGRILPAGAPIRFSGCILRAGHRPKRMGIRHRYARAAYATCRRCFVTFCLPPRTVSHERLMPVLSNGDLGGVLWTCRLPGSILANTWPRRGRDHSRRVVAVTRAGWAEGGPGGGGAPGSRVAGRPAAQPTRRPRSRLSAAASS
jgi:hypothetical protein